MAELAPRYNQRAARSEFSWEAHRRLAGLGVLGIGLPEKYGGTGVPDPVTLGIATEALAYGDVNVASAPVLSGLVAAQLAENGQDAVVERWLPELIAGDAIAAIAVTEPSGGFRRLKPAYAGAPGARRLADQWREDRDHPRHGGCDRPGLRPRARIGRLPRHQLLRRSARP